MRLYLSYKASSPTAVVLIENEGNAIMLLGPTLPVFLSDGVGITVVQYDGDGGNLFSVCTWES